MQNAVVTTAAIYAVVVLHLNAFPNSPLGSRSSSTRNGFILWFI